MILGHRLKSFPGANHWCHAQNDIIWIIWNRKVIDRLHLTLMNDFSWNIVITVSNHQVHALTKQLTLVIAFKHGIRHRTEKIHFPSAFPLQQRVSSLSFTRFLEKLNARSSCHWVCCKFSIRPARNRQISKQYTIVSEKSLPSAAQPQALLAGNYAVRTAAAHNLHIAPEGSALDGFDVMRA